MAQGIVLGQKAVADDFSRNTKEGDDDCNPGGQGNTLF